MDFFSGSATTADAVMQLSAKDGKKRQYLMIQLKNQRAIPKLVVMGINQFVR